MPFRPLAVAALIIVGPSSAALAEDVVLSTYGIGQDQYRKDLYAPFEAQCGCKVVTDTGNSAARLAKLEAHKDNPDTDVAALSDAAAAQAAKEGLVEPLDIGALTNYGKIYPFAQDPVGGHLAVGYTFYATSIVYRSDKVKTIASWKDLWSPELAKRIALPDIATTQGVPVAYMLNRVFDGTMPDMKTGITKLAGLKDSAVTFYPSSAVVTQLFQQDEIWAAPVGRFDWPNLKKLDVPLAWATPAEGQSGGMNVLVLIKGAPHKAQAIKLIDYWLSTQAQTAIGTDKVDSPANAEVKLPSDAADVLVYGDAAVKSLHLVPPDVVLANRAAWLAEWNASMAH
jgi:putative spermidine/putrescine transport system substrate-binding protein